jgi:hypothetical protein
LIAGHQPSSTSATASLNVMPIESAGAPEREHPRQTRISNTSAGPLGQRGHGRVLEIAHVTFLAGHWIRVAPPARPYVRRQVTEKPCRSPRARSGLRGSEPTTLSLRARSHAVRFGQQQRANHERRRATTIG